MVGIEAQDTPKSKIGRKKDLLLLAAAKESTGDLSQSSVSPNSKIGEFLSEIQFSDLVVSNSL